MKSSDTSIQQRTKENGERERHRNRENYLAHIFFPPLFLFTGIINYYSAGK